MNSQNKQAKRRLKQLGATLDPSRAGWSDSEEEDLIHESKYFKHILLLAPHTKNCHFFLRTVGIRSVRIGDVEMEIYSPKNPELVPEVQGPFYEGSQVRICAIWLIFVIKLCITRIY